MDYILAPSILSADFKVLGEQMKLTEDNGAKYLHFDVMDGMFVPSISFGMPVLNLSTMQQTRLWMRILWCRNQFVTWRLLKKQEPIS